MTTELYKRVRPKTVEGLVGNPGAKALLKKYAADPTRIPHAIVLTGESGTGKTTVARIIAGLLGCHPTEFVEMNSSQFNGVDTSRDLIRKMMYKPRNGKVRVYLLDESHRMSAEAQDALLKPLEDTPAHVYFMIATTEPGKLKKAILTRSTQIDMRPLTPETIFKFLLQPIVAKQKIETTDKVLELIARDCNGSARTALVCLESCIGLEPKEQISVVKARARAEDEAVNLCQMLLYKKPWGEIREALKSVKGEPESIRRGVLGYMTAVALNADGKKVMQAYDIICCFQKNYYDSGKAGLVASFIDALFNGGQEE